MYLIAGLGNPEQKYAATRHNVGFEAAELLRNEIGCGLRKLQCHAEIGKGRIGTEQVIVARPLTYMNLSGTAIRELCDYYKIEPENVIVFCDDVNIPFGHLRIRQGGSAGGHNGLKNIIQMLSSDRFVRIRIGVGDKPEGWDLAAHVLAHMSDAEMTALSETLKNATQAARTVITDGLQIAMSRYNTPKEKKPDKKSQEQPSAEPAATEKPEQ